MDAIAARIEDLQTKLAERQGKPGYKRNCEALRAEISRLSAIQETTAEVSP